MLSLEHITSWNYIEKESVLDKSIHTNNSDVHVQNECYHDYCKSYHK